MPLRIIKSKRLWVIILVLIGIFFLPISLNFIFIGFDSIVLSLPLRDNIFKIRLIFNVTDSFLNLPEELPDEVADNAKDEESLRQNRQRKRVAEGRRAISDTRSRKRNFVTQKDVDSRKVEDIYHVDAEEEGYDNYYEDVLTIDHDFKQKRRIPFKEIGIILVALTALVIFAYFFLINNFDFD